MLEHRARLHFEHVRGVRTRQPVVELRLDGVADAGAGLGGFLPVEGEDAGEFGEELAGDFFDFVALVGGEVGAGAREEVEDDELFFGELLAGVASLFVGEGAGEFQ